MLHAASRANNEQMVQLLISDGCDVNIVNAVSCISFIYECIYVIVKYSRMEILHFIMLPGMAIQVLLIYYFSTDAMLMCQTK